MAQQDAPLDTMDAAVDPGQGDEGGGDAGGGSDDQGEDGSAGKVVTFFDGDFTGAWSAGLSTVHTMNDAGFVVTPMEKDGNPDRYMESKAIFTPPTTAGHQYHLLHFWADAVFDPSSQGAVAWIDYSFDGVHFPNPDAPDWGTDRPVSMVPILRQGDAVYHASNGLYVEVQVDKDCNGIWSGPGTGCHAEGWQRRTMVELGAPQFNRLQGSGPQNPDFEASGGPITFGYMMAYSSGGWTTPVDNRRCGMDNYGLTIHVE